jgi:hypothetical protein
MTMDLSAPSILSRHVFIPRMIWPNDERQGRKFAPVETSLFFRRVLESFVDRRVDRAMKGAAVPDFLAARKNPRVRLKFPQEAGGPSVGSG